MYARKERKIPGSVLKPHNQHCCLVQSNSMRSEVKQIRVYFPYPQYCYRLNTHESFLTIRDHLEEVKNSSFQQLRQIHQFKMMEKNMTLGFKVHDSTHIYNSVVNTMKAAGVRIVPPSSGKWNVIWTGMCKPD
mmetsp:Transcript_26311/g.40152  ORF Transcript_26311/g.40152 Transcript_26311/m.40152 type:complete len:133 (+) Transcript_26311:2122-2520(+)